MNELLRKGISLGLGMTMASKDKIQAFVEDMVKRGELTPGESGAWMSSLMERGEKEREELKRMMREQFQRMLQDLNVARREDLLELKRRVEALEAGGGGAANGALSGAAEAVGSMAAGGMAGGTVGATTAGAMGAATGAAHQSAQLTTASSTGTPESLPPSEQAAVPAGAASADLNAGLAESNPEGAGAPLSRTEP